ncbi:hypothetical protein KSD_70340 [Ktedonobacter sp. SOSP1-85]|uniref:hypothetical protein n=1 Tax=Ktedonobacter sp. SOSP1-85 TaxID=2778367 RepID=UPI0019151BDF|nr:hypothetical protein [Ktedonobacter sp. SOSP1-85]GHO79263.1 hypothetical protein KSD_70340 [Ktedonobacter sp. SOSP1-85]
MEENTETTSAAEADAARATVVALRSEGFPQELGMRDLTSLLLLFIKPARKTLGFSHRDMRAVPFVGG